MRIIEGGLSFSAASVDPCATLPLRWTHFTAMYSLFQSASPPMCGTATLMM